MTTNTGPDLKSGLTPSLTYLGLRSEETGKMAGVGLRKQALTSVATPRGRKQSCPCLLPEMLGLGLQYRGSSSDSLGQPEAPPQRPQYPTGQPAKATPC